MHCSVYISKVKCGRRSKGEIAILLGEAIGREEAGEEHRYVQQSKAEQHDGDCPIRSHVKFSERMRGSAANRSRSDNSMPLTRNNAANITAPITTYRSRESIASSKKGPRPGQLITTSVSSDALRSDPKERPNREISGFIASGKAWQRTIRRGDSP